MKCNGIDVVTIPATQENEMARDEGGIARLDGRPYLSNPYGRHEPELRDAWSVGWTETDRSLRTGKLPGEF